MKKEEHSSTVDTTTLEISLVVAQKTGHDTTRELCYTTPGHIPRRFPSMQYESMFHYVHGSPIYNSQKLERMQMSHKEEWIQKIWYIYKMDYYAALINNKFMKFLDRKAGTGEYHSK